MKIKGLISLCLRPGSGLNPLNDTCCWTRRSAALSSFSQTTGESQVLPWLWVVLFLLGFGVVMPARKHRRSRVTNISFQKALHKCHLYHPLVPPAALAAHCPLSCIRAKMLESSPGDCLSNVLIKMINAIDPCWPFLARNRPAFLTYCVFFQHKECKKNLYRSA